MNTKNSRIQLMSEGNVTRSLFKLGIPMVVSMLVTALYNVVDTYFVSGLGTSPMAAVSVAFPLSLIFSGIGLTFGAGAGSLISRLLGAQKKKEADQLASTALFTSLIVGIIIAVLILIFLNPVLRFMGATETILPHAKTYAVFFIISTIFSTGNVTAGNLAVSQGASQISLTAMISGAVLNMILDPLLIYTLNMGIRGSAVATLISQIVTSAIYICFFIGDKSYIKIKFSNIHPKVKTYTEIIKIGISMLLLQVLCSLSMSLISKSASGYGDEAVAAMGIALRILTIGTNVVFGFLKGFQPMAGFNYGAKNYERLKEAIRSSMKCTTSFCILWTVLIFIFANPIVSLFSKDAQVIQIAEKALRANTIMFFTFGFQFTYSTIYLALGRAISGLILNISRQGIFFIPVILILTRFFNLNGVIYSQSVADLLTTIVTIFFAIKVEKEIRQLHKITTKSHIILE